MALVLTLYLTSVASLDGKTVFDPSIRDRLKDYDIHQSLGRRYRGLATNVYETKDGRFFHTHGRFAFSVSTVIAPDLLLVFLSVSTLDQLKPCLEWNISVMTWYGFPFFASFRANYF